MGIVSIAVMIMAVTLVVLAAAIVPAFIEIRKTAAALRETLERIEGDIKPMIRDLNATVSDLNLLVHETSGKREDVALFMESLGDTGRNLRTINEVAGSVAGVLSTSSLWMTGAKVAGKYAVERLLTKRGKTDGKQ